MFFFKRYFFLFLGLLIMSFGVAFSVKASLGTSPISSVPYVVSLISPLTVGIATIVMHIIFILIQIVLLRKDFKVVQLIQIPVWRGKESYLQYAMFLRFHSQKPK